jgi:hypothetical protein
MRRGALGRPISIYVNGKQVRDVLWIGDLVRAYDLAAGHVDIAAGQIYNVGGGPANAMSVCAEFGPLLRAQRELGWTPQLGLRDGVERCAPGKQESSAVQPLRFARGNCPAG